MPTLKKNKSFMKAGLEARPRPTEGAEPARSARAASGSKMTQAPRRVYSSKSDIVLTAAERVFLRLGFAATSMDEVAEEAGVSKRTVYSNFGSKEQLFAAVIRARCTSVKPHEKIFSQALELPPMEGLKMLAISFLKEIFASEQLELYQTCVAAARSRPEVAAILLDGPIAETQQRFSDFLTSHVEAGRMDLEDPNIAAAHLVALLKTNLHMKLMLGQPVRLGPKRIAQSADSSIRLFMNGALPRS